MLHPISEIAKTVKCLLLEPQVFRFTEWTSRTFPVGTLTTVWTGRVPDADNKQYCGRELTEVLLHLYTVILDYGRFVLTFFTNFRIVVSLLSVLTLSGHGRPVFGVEEMCGCESLLVTPFPDTGLGHPTTPRWRGTREGCFSPRQCLLPPSGEVLEETSRGTYSEEWE